MKNHNILHEWESCFYRHRGINSLDVAFLHQDFNGFGTECFDLQKKAEKLNGTGNFAHKSLEPTNTSDSLMYSHRRSCSIWRSRSEVDMAEQSRFESLRRRSETIFHHLLPFLDLFCEMALEFNPVAAAPAPRFTTSNGAPVDDDQNSLTVGFVAFSVVCRSKMA